METQNNPVVVNSVESGIEPQVIAQAATVQQPVATPRDLAPRDLAELSENAVFPANEGELNDLMELVQQQLTEIAALEPIIGPDGEEIDFDNLDAAAAGAAAGADGDGGGFVRLDRVAESVDSLAFAYRFEPQDTVEFLLGSVNADTTEDLIDEDVVAPSPPDDDEEPENPPPPPPDDDGKGGPKGNNGVGNGEDPQPPGNPPVNDGPGTGPGNPGNQGGTPGQGNQGNNPNNPNNPRNEEPQDEDSEDPVIPDDDQQDAEQPQDPQVPPQDEDEDPVEQDPTVPDDEEGSEQGPGTPGDDTVPPPPENPTGGNPGNDKPVGNSPWDGHTGASGNGRPNQNGNPNFTGDDSEPNQPPGRTKNALRFDDLLTEGNNEQPDSTNIVDNYNVLFDYNISVVVEHPTNDI